MLGSPFEAEDASRHVRPRRRDRSGSEGRSALRSWLYKIATNVCLDAPSDGAPRRCPMDFGPAQEPVIENLNERPEATWLLPAPDPADAAVERESIRLAFVAGPLQHLAATPAHR
jgi:RNA polymerase sigma-70 factor (ECF subfamily)